MKINEIMDELASRADEAVKAVYQQQGAGDNLFGVHYNQLKRIKKLIKGYDSTLGLELWNTGNIDAQSLACMIINPDDLEVNEVDKMAHMLSFQQLCDIFVKNIVSKTGYMKDLFKKWIDSDNLFVQRTGWRTLSKIAMEDTDLQDSFFLPFIKIIQESIRQEKDIIKEAMNACMIAIGLRNEELELQISEAEEKIGKLFNENTIFSFRYPSPTAYIQKMKKIPGHEGGTLY